MLLITLISLVFFTVAYREKLWGFFNLIWIATQTKAKTMWSLKFTSLGGIAPQLPATIQMEVRFPHNPPLFLHGEFNDRYQQQCRNGWETIVTGAYTHTAFSGRIELTLLNATRARCKYCQGEFNVHWRLDGSWEQMK